MSDTATATPTASALEARLRQVLGNNHVLTDPKDRQFFSSDVFREADPAAFVIQPATPEELSAAAAAASAEGYAVIARGGGLSYTDAYLPASTKSVVVDLQRLNRIVEINAEDMYAVVEAGCTWLQVFDALKAKGLRAPYFGALSGMYSTVGGAMSQNSIFFGSGLHGTAADSCLGLEVVLSDGRILKTGSWATPFNPSPFFRSYGPDLTGLFLADAGALGFKTKVVLRLIPFPTETRFLSFAFDEAADVTAAMGEVSRRSLAAECFAFDPYLQGQRLKREGLLTDVKRLANVARSGKSLLDGVKGAAKVAAGGRRMFEGVEYSLHLVIDGYDKKTVETMVAEAKKVCGDRKGKEIQASLPQIMRATPFVPPNSMLGPEGQRWVPIHALVPHSRAATLVKSVHDYFEARQELVDRHGIEWGYLMCAVAQQTFLMEPVFFWEDARHAYHDRYLGKDYIGKLKTFPADEAARAAVTELRSGLADLFKEFGAVHFQIGKAYRYREGRNPDTYALLEAIKNYVDPARMMNPGALGLD
ncbi:MAG: FAD-binding oxidoreductase [Alphaproteobacteria bacterium]